MNTKIAGRTASKKYFPNVSKIVSRKDSDIEAWNSFTEDHCDSFIKIISFAGEYIHLFTGVNEDSFQELIETFIQLYIDLFGKLFIKSR